MGRVQGVGRSGTFQAKGGWVESVSSGEWVGNRRWGCDPADLLDPSSIAQAVQSSLRLLGSVPLLEMVQFQVDPSELLLHYPGKGKAAAPNSCWDAAQACQPTYSSVC